jgi:serine/threonine protein kinase
MLAGDATKGTSDLYSAGVVFGQFLNSYISHPSLSLLGSRLVDPTMTTSIARTISESLDEQAFASLSYGNNDGASSYCHIPLLRHAAHLLGRMLEPEAATRITAADALKHPFLTAPDSEFEGTDSITFREKYPQTLIGGFVQQRKRERVYCYERS